MKFKFPGEIKAFENCSIGELVQFNLHGEAALAIFLGVNEENNSVLLGVLRCGGELQAPLILRGDRDADCVAFGGAWIVEPEMGALTYPGDRSYEREFGVLQIERENRYVSFRIDTRRSIGLRPAWVNLEKFTTQGWPGGAAVPCTKWKIWVNEEDRNDSNSRPIFEMSVLE